MCLYAKHSKPLIAKRNITCYKLLKTDGSTLVSWYHKNFRWTAGVLRKARMKKDARFVPEINVGFHAYRTKIALQRAVRKQINWYGSDENLMRFAKMTIPAGSLYYKGKNDDIASNQIILVEIMKKI